MMYTSLLALSPLLCASAYAQAEASSTSSAATPIDTNNPSIVANKANITCPEGNGIHIIVARGSLEQQGEGMTGTLANNITERIPGSTSQGLVYPAVLFPYFESEGNGVGNLTQLLYDFSSACPSSKYALLGWSQGGQVILDTLCGNSEPSFMNSPPISSQYTENLLAVVTYGDPSFRSGLSYDRGTATRNGIFNRTDQAACDPYASRIHSYCDQNDTYCTNYNASGLAIHFGYFNKYNTDATQFVVDQYNNASGSMPSGGSSMDPSSTATMSSDPSASMTPVSETGGSSSIPSSSTPPAPTNTGAASWSLTTNAGLMSILLGVVTFMVSL